MSLLFKIGALLKELYRSMGLAFKSFNRVDVAVDFCGVSHDVEGVVRSLAVNALRVSGRKKAINFYSETVKGNTVYEGVKIGSRTSSRFLRIYHKTKELKSNLKTYILDSWAALGLDKSNVWRYEYQINAAFLRDLEGLTIDSLMTKDGIYSLLKKAQNNHFELRYNTGKKEVNKEKPFYMFDWDVLENTVKTVASEIKKIKRVVKETFIGQQRMIKGLLRSYFSKRQKRIEYLLPLKIMLNDFDLWEWFGKKLPFYIDEFSKKMIIGEADLRTFNDDFIVEI